MSWSDEQLQRLHTVMAQAKRAGAWISAGDARIVLDLIFTYRRMAMRKGWSGPAEGHVPTIGQCRRQGLTSLYVTCERYGCHSRRRFSFDDLKLPDHVVFVEIPKHCRFRCIRCGGRQVNVMADWPDPVAAQQRKMMGENERR